MSSYLSIVITNKKTYEEYSKEYDKLDESNEDRWFIDYSPAFDLLRKNSFMLYCCSRSFEPYGVICDTCGYTDKYMILNKSSLNEALDDIRKKYDDIQGEIEYYKKYGGLRGQACSKRVKNAINYLDEISEYLNVEKIDNIKSLLLKVDNDDEYYFNIEEYEDELYELERAKTVLTALVIFYDETDDENIIIYMMD